MLRKMIICVALFGTFVVAGYAQDRNQTDSQTQSEVRTRANRATQQTTQSNEQIAQPKRVEDSYPLDQASREKSVKILQQTTVDLLSLFNMYKEAHWNVNGPLYLPLHEYYQNQADTYRGQADIFAERALELGYSVDGRYSTINKTTKIPDFPAGWVTDNESLKLLIDRTTIFQKEVYQYIKDTEDTDAPTSNKFQDLAYMVDKDLWKLRVHLQKPGGKGEDLPYSDKQGRDRTNP